MDMLDREDRSEKHENGMGEIDGEVSEGECRCVKKELSWVKVRIEVQKGN